MLQLEGSELEYLKPFRSLDVWLSDSRFKPLVKSEWTLLHGASLPLKLKLLKNPIKKWNREIFGHIDTRVQSLEKEIDNMDSLADQRPLSEVKTTRHLALNPTLQKWRNRKAQVLRQYSRLKNITEMDCNSKYFHAVANSRRKKKRLLKINIGSEIIKGQLNLKKGIRQHFLEHFKQEPLPEITLPRGSFKHIHPSLIPSLDSIPTDEGIMEAIKSCDPRKAPGYNGFNLRFLIQMWDIVGSDIL